MKNLVITDIHQNYDAALSAGTIESPDIVLDCGDHEEVINIFGSTPHFYIRGNHEPSIVSFNKGDYPLPTSIPIGTMMQFTYENDTVTFSGIDGNYGAKQTIFQVNENVLQQLRKIEPNTIDIMLLHESPFNVSKSSRGYNLAAEVLKELDRLQPQLVFSGHSNMFLEQLSPRKVKFITLDDMCNGYGALVKKGNNLTFERKRFF